MLRLVWDWRNSQTQTYMEADELLQRYARGERDFRGVELFDDEYFDDEPFRRKSPVNLKNADLTGINLAGADFSHATLKGINLSYADLSGANLSNVDQIEEEFDTCAPMNDLQESEDAFINLSYAKLSKANLTNADLTGADLTGADLSNVDLTNTILEDVKLIAANLCNASLSGLDLSHLDLSNAKLVDADLTFTDLSFTNLTGADLTGADLSGANIDGTILGAQKASEELQQKNQSLESLDQKNQELAKQVTLLKAQLEKQTAVQNLNQPSNQGINAPYQWSGFYFRSKTEIRIAEALDRAGVLFYPNSKARLNKAQARINKESDFLVFQAGKFGILEVDGERWHPPSRTVDDHERDRLFKAHGIRIVEHYDATRCWNEPDKVVQEFLEILRQA